MRLSPATWRSWRTFETKSGRVVDLRIYAEAKNIDRCDFAMASLKRAMRWDEDRFGLEYDLDLFNIVAVDDFNMGAMENKSLNLFNSRLVLATPESATDTAFARIEGVIGHEYFTTGPETRGVQRLVPALPEGGPACSATRSSPPTCLRAP